MTDDSTVDLESAEEIDWLREGRDPEEALHEFTAQATKELLHIPERPNADVDPDEVDEAYQEFNTTVNMTAAELREWGDHACSDEASVKPEAVRQRLIRLLETPKQDWGDKEINEAERVVSYITRVRDLEPGDGPEGCPSDRDISLMNWGYRPDSVEP